MQFQDAVRIRIDDIYGAYVVALGVRQTARYAAASVKGLERMVTLNESLLQRGQIPLSDLNLVKIKLQTARLGLFDADTAYRKAKLRLGSLMNLTNDEARSFELKGSIVNPAPPPPGADELTRMALEFRPDVISFRLGVSRAESDVRLARANAMSDVYVLWQPYTFQDNSPYGLKGQYSWASV